MTPPLCKSVIIKFCFYEKKTFISYNDKICTRCVRVFNRQIDY